MSFIVEIEKLIPGDTRSFEAVFKKYYAPLCVYSKGLLPDHSIETAQDIVQQTFVKLWEQGDQLEIRTSLKSYLYRSVHNNTINKLRHLKTQSKYRAHALLHHDQTTPHPGMEKELAEKIQLAIQKLPTQCRNIFELSRFDELKYKEIAEQLQISIKTVETQMGKALRLLRTELAEYLIALLIIIFSFIQTV